ncbi:YeeE/YedE family protein [Psychromonas ossibalaenae]|uniref:YeeE/YedE family protein n=1 Tax=Psychromonas ossibalaenae TaxID=444922 RepID=UPI000371E268|nr:YeeE/YedE family protein [Psychromonas ossibalaenae]
MFTILVGLICGALFGSGMIISGMVDPAKVIAFLNISGDWDPSLMFVMGGALAVFTPIYHLLIKKRSNALNGEKLSWASNKQIDATLITGSAIFGIGWGLAGFCPGPVMASLGGGSSTIMMFLASMLIGMTAAKYYLRGAFPLPFLGRYKNSIPSQASK